MEEIEAHLFETRSDLQPLEAGLFVHQFTNTDVPNDVKAWLKYLVTLKGADDISTSIRDDPGLRDVFFGDRGTTEQTGRVRSYTFWSKGFYESAKTAGWAISNSESLWYQAWPSPPVYDSFFILDPRSLKDNVLKDPTQEWKELVALPVTKCGGVQNLISNSWERLCPGGAGIYSLYTNIKDYYGEVSTSDPPSPGNNEWVMSEFSTYSWENNPPKDKESSKTAEKFCNKKSYPFLALGIVKLSPDNDAERFKRMIIYTVTTWLAFNAYRPAGDLIPLLFAEPTPLSSIFGDTDEVTSMFQIFEEDIKLDTGKTFHDALKVKKTDINALQKWLFKCAATSTTEPDWLYNEILDTVQS